MTDKEKINEILQLAVGYRGGILNQCIQLEKAMDEFICQYFTPDRDKQVEIFVILLDRLTFQNKKDILNTILIKIEDNSAIKRHKKAYKHYPLIENIRKIGMERNFLAHYMINTFQDGLDAYPEKIGFIEFRDNANVKWYTEKYYLDLLDKIHKCHDEVNDLIERVLPSLV